MEKLDNALALLVYGLIALPFAFRLTHDIVSRQGEPGADDYFDGFRGPFDIYRLIRWILTHPKAPENWKEGATCRYCMSFGISYLVTIYIVPLGHTWIEWLVLGGSVGGCIVWFFCWINMGSEARKYGISANDF